MRAAIEYIIGIDGMRHAMNIAAAGIYFIFEQIELLWEEQNV